MLGELRHRRPEINSFVYGLPIRSDKSVRGSYADARPMGFHHAIDVRGLAAARGPRPETGPVFPSCVHNNAPVKEPARCSALFSGVEGACPDSRYSRSRRTCSRPVCDSTAAWCKRASIPKKKMIRRQTSILYIFLALINQENSTGSSGCERMLRF